MPIVPDAPLGPLLHLALASDWEAARAAGEYRVSTLGRTLDEVGFIHLSFPHQLAAVAESFYRDVDGDLVVLEVDPARLVAPVVVEPGGPDPGSERFPHLYGPLPVDAVVQVSPAWFEDGRFAVGR